MTGEWEMEEGGMDFEDVDQEESAEASLPPVQNEEKPAVADVLGKPAENGGGGGGRTRGMDF